MVRLGFAAFAFLLLLIPIALVQNIIDERTNNRDQAKFDIAQGWGQAQTIGGPWLVVPTTHIVTTTASDPSQKRPSIVALQILAESTTISATIAPELRTRGIYEVPVYTATVIIEGKLPKDLAKHVPDDTVADWSMAALHVNIADLAAVRAFKTEHEAAFKPLQL